MYCSGRSVYIIVMCLFSSEEKGSERDSSTSAQSLPPGEVVDRDWFNT